MIHLLLGLALASQQLPGVPNDPTISYVSQLSGHDPNDASTAPDSWGTSGVWNNRIRPFRTVAAATRASKPFDTIQVYAAKYSSDSITSCAGLRNYVFAFGAHLSDGSETFVGGASWNTFALQTANILAFIDPTVLGSQWTNAGATTQLVKTGQLFTVGTPQTINGLQIDAANNWVVSGSGTAMTSAAGPVAGTLVMQSTGTGTELQKSFTPPTNGHMSLIAAIMSTGALGSGNGQLIGPHTTGSAFLAFQWSTTTHINMLAGSGGGGGGFNCTPTSWAVYSASFGGASSLVMYLNGVSQGTSAQSLIASGAATNCNLNGDPAVGQAGQTGNNFGPVILLNTDSETGNNSFIRILYQNYAAVAVGTF